MSWLRSLNAISSASASSTPGSVSMSRGILSVMGASLSESAVILAGLAVVVSIHLRIRAIPDEEFGLSSRSHLRAVLPAIAFEGRRGRRCDGSHGSCLRRRGKAGNNDRFLSEMPVAIPGHEHEQCDQQNPFHALSGFMRDKSSDSCGYAESYNA